MAATTTAPLSRIRLARRFRVYKRREARVAKPRQIDQLREAAEEAMAAYRSIFGPNAFWDQRDRAAFAHLDKVLRL